MERSYGKGCVWVMYRIGVIGEGDGILGFLAAGFSVYPVASAAQAAERLHALAKENFAVLFITEELAEKISADIEAYRTCPLPAIVLIPSKDGTAGTGMANIRGSVIRAVGADILPDSDA